MEEIKICRRCHRRLKDLESKERGFGKTCYKKYLESISYKRRLFNIEEVQNNGLHNKQTINS